ncbi:MAG TPA: Ig-like domain-containing protein, partial [Patescibacteria group bacterium]|nr:Ig-like domain-containing protein [Patescibacteria group bacterium]
VVVGLAAPVATQARPPVSVTQVGPASLSARIEAHHGLREPVHLSFSAAMDAPSVAKALTVDPAAGVELSWDASGQTLTVAPKAGWKAATYYTITIGRSALDATGQALAAPARAVFTTRGAMGARLALSAAPQKGRVPASTSVLVVFDGPVDETAAKAAFHIEPAVEGTFETSTSSAGGTSVTFVPTALTPNTAYTVSLTGVVKDAEGVAIAPLAPLAFRTSKGASIIRFRPFAGSTGIDRTALLSVRFTDRMARDATESAFSAKIGTKTLKGTFSWAEDDTVLVFDPASVLPFGVKVVMTVAAAATDRAGTPINASKSATFKVVAKPKPGARPASVAIAHGRSVGAGSWHAVETYYLKLMNCTRGGGWVTSGGSCSSPGGSGIAPLILSSGISTHVSRPYAKFLAGSGICSHFADGDPGDRLRRAGYAGDYRENIGCRSASNPFSSVLGTHLFFQDEKPCGGYCHYANIMSTKMKYVGIGVWVANGRVRLVVDFWEG